VRAGLDRLHSELARDPSALADFQLTISTEQTTAPGEPSLSPRPDQGTVFLLHDIDPNFYSWEPCFLEL
jgi:hypothetical protein